MRVQIRWNQVMVPCGPSDLDEVVEVEHVGEVIPKLVELALARAKDAHKVGMMKASAHSGGGELLATVGIPLAALRHWRKAS